MSYIDRRMGMTSSFDAYVKDNWHSDIPEDCTKIDADEADCLDRVDPEPCPSCQLYDRLADQFDRMTRQEKPY